jgi:hypothetical protein
MISDKPVKLSRIAAAVPRRLAQTLETSMRAPVPAFVLIAALTGGVAFAQPAPAGPPSVSLQGDQQSWIRDPHMRAFYDLTVRAFAQGPHKVDEVRFHDDAMAIFRDFALSRHVPPAAMEDHLKLIPGQVVHIARDDPKVLQSYEAFVTATFGPQ